MTTDDAGRRIAIQGAALIFVGLVWGLVVPNTPYPRLGLGAHIQFTTNGLLFLAMGVLVVQLAPKLGPKSLWAMVVAAWLTWPMALSEVGNAWWGTNEMLTIAAAQAGAPGGLPWQEDFVRTSHMVAGIALIVAWGLFTVGLVRERISRRRGPPGS